MLSKLDKVKDERVLIGYDTADDAGVYLFDNGICVIQTVDFFAPVVDDPEDYGRIAAANALSDIYAMGGTPIYALSVVCFPIEKLGRDVLADILRGAQRKAAEAGVSIIGGHSVNDSEPKFGLSVTGLSTVNKLVTNSGARPGDVLLLTKPLGSGIITTALKQGKAAPQQVEAAVEMMSGLNKDASEVMVEVGVHACTDVTGFGLIGHMQEMLKAGRVAAIVTEGEVPRLPGLRDLALAGAVPGGTMANMRFVEAQTDWHPSIDELDRVILCDAQTSGGLLISCPPDRVDQLREALGERGVDAPVIGVVFDGPAGAIVVVP